MTPTRIVSWNVCGGGGQRIGKIAAALATLLPSVVVLNEVTGNRLVQWKQALKDIGLVCQHDQIESVSKADPYTVLVASRQKSTLHPWNTVPPFPNRALRVNVGGLSVTGIHAPDQKAPGREFYRWLVHAAAVSLSGTSILVGDFNADESGAAMPLNRDFQKLIGAGWVHGTRQHNATGDHASWWSRTRGLAIDHCLLSPPLAPHLTKAEILPSVDNVQTAGAGMRIAAGALSDHRPLLIELALQAK